MYQFSNIYVLAGFGTLGGAIFGFQISSLSAFIGASQFIDYFNRPNSGLIGGITASMSAGSFAGSLAAGFISDKLGRRKSLMVASIIWIIGAILQASAQNVAHLVAGQVCHLTQERLPCIIFDPCIRKSTMLTSDVATTGCGRSQYRYYQLPVLRLSRRTCPRQDSWTNCWHPAMVH
jgi:MFS family permease